MHRRSLLNTTATMAVGAVAGCALPGTAQQPSGVKTPFVVPATYVVGPANFTLTRPHHSGWLLQAA
jgi:hypothetical protein